jgi:hypothetical protein
VAPVLAAMDPDSVSRQELVRTVADRLDTDAGLVTRRIDREGRGGRAMAPADADRGAPAKAGEPARPRSARERRGRALIAMCLAAPAKGREYLARLTPAHLSSPLMTRALEWTRDHLDDPMAGLPREDGELVSVVTQLVMASRREPASREAMELNLLWLEQAMIDDQIAAQAGAGDPPVELQRRRAELGERIKHWEGQGNEVRREER